MQSLRAAVLAAGRSLLRSYELPASRVAFSTVAEETATAGKPLVNAWSEHKRKHISANSGRNDTRRRLDREYRTQKDARRRVKEASEALRRRDEERVARWRQRALWARESAAVRAAREDQPAAASAPEVL